MKKILILIFSLLSFISCSNDNDDNNTSTVNIRLSNVSQYNYQNIFVNTSTGKTNFENLNSQEMTNYKSFEKAYFYAFVELEIDGETYTLQPIDYVGETPLKNGYYTYEIDANDSQEQYGRLSLTLIEE